MLYQTYELQRSMLAGASAWANWGADLLHNPANPFSHLDGSAEMASALEVFAHAAAPRGKPAFGLTSTVVDGREVAVCEEIVARRPFGQLKRFRREGVEGGPRLLIVAPMSGHYATLLRGTVERMLPTADVYITDWRDARAVPLAEGRFDLDDYIDYLIGFCEVIGERTGDARPHVLAVCQPSVPCYAAAWPDERRRASQPAAYLDHDGRADRHARGADRGQHGRYPAPVRLVREQCHRHRSTALCRRRAARVPGVPPAYRLPGDEPG